VSGVGGEPGAAPATGLVREVAALLAAALVTRGELAAVELAEARERAGRWLLLALVGGVLLLAALLVAALWPVAFFWESHRSAAIAGVAIVYALLGAGVLGWLVARLRAAPPLFETTLVELKRDCDAMRGAARRSQ
jgi:uncharacterized membrane protein YqjE